MYSLKALIARIAGTLSRLLGRGGGTSLPGKVLIFLDKKALARMGRRLKLGSVIVSATNGKTTTSNMIAKAMQEVGTTTVHNSAGANLESGIATCLLYSSTLSGEPKAELGLFEVDEAAMPSVAAAVEPKILLLSNLFRDQLDRYGELEVIADSWAEEVARERDRELVLCADDPLIADLGRTAEGAMVRRVTYFGIEDKEHGLPGLQHASDSKLCRTCGKELAYEIVTMGHLGHYMCTSCGSARPKPTVSAEDISLKGMSGSSFTLSCGGASTRIDLLLPGMYNIYNALAAAACCIQLGVSLYRIKQALEDFSAAFGRVEVVDLDSRSAAIFLIKNPAGANEVIRTLIEDDTEKIDLVIALNDNIADGRDVSWVWDADFEHLAGLIGAVVCSGTRAEEMALRVKYSGVDKDLISIEKDTYLAVEQAGRSDSSRPLYVLPTYTALLHLYKSLEKSGRVSHFWEKRQ